MGVMPLDTRRAKWFPFTARLSFFEYDGTGTEPHIGSAFEYAYDASAGCWLRQFAFAPVPCVDASNTDDGDLTLQAVSGSPVDVDLRWHVRVP